MRRLSPIPFLLFLQIGCATYYNPITEREERILIGSTQEVAIGRNVAGQLERRYGIYEDEELINYIDRVGQKVAEASDRKDIPYHFNILNLEQVNAFACPGGFIYVTRGLLDSDKIDVSEEELACVLGHEIGHVAVRHSVKRIQADLGYSIVTSLLLKGKRYEDIRKAANVGFNLTVLGYGRKYEFQADELGTIYAYRAGYDPRAMASFLKKLKEMEGREPWALEILLNSHPPTSERIKKVEDVIEDLPPR